MSLDPQWFAGDDFVMVHPAAVAHLDGDVIAVYLLARLRYRARAFGYDRDGRRWWRVSADVLADDLGLTVPRVRRTLAKLLERELVIVEKHREHGSYDHTQSYALAYAEEPENRATTVVTESSQRSDEIAPSEVTKSSHLEVTKSSHLPIRSQEVKEGTGPLASLAVTVDNFGEFWQAYPRRVGEAAARRAWFKARQHADPEVIIAAARRYASSDLPEARYVPAPASWLRDHRWTDELPEPASTTSRGTAADGTPPDDVANDPAAYLAWLREQRRNAAGG